MLDSSNERGMRLARSAPVTYTLRDGQVCIAIVRHVDPGGMVLEAAVPVAVGTALRVRITNQRATSDPQVLVTLEAEARVVRCGTEDEFRKTWFWTVRPLAAPPHQLRWLSRLLIEEMGVRLCGDGRVMADPQATLRLPKGTWVPLQLRDISLGGVSWWSPPSVTVGEDAELRLTFAQTIETRVTVIRSEPLANGVSVAASLAPEGRRLLHEALLDRCVACLSLPVRR